jgi:hypothetical protein
VDLDLPLRCLFTLYKGYLTLLGSSGIQTTKIHIAGIFCPQEFKNPGCGSWYPGVSEDNRVPPYSGSWLSFSSLGVYPFSDFSGTSSGRVLLLVCRIFPFVVQILEGANNCWKLMADQHWPWENWEVYSKMILRSKGVAAFFSLISFDAWGAADWLIPYYCCLTLPSCHGETMVKSWDAWSIFVVVHKKLSSFACDLFLWHLYYASFKDELLTHPGMKFMVSPNQWIIEVMMFPICFPYSLRTGKWPFSSLIFPFNMVDLSIVM